MTSSNVFLFLTYIRALLRLESCTPGECHKWMIFVIIFILTICSPKPECEPYESPLSVFVGHEASSTRLVKDLLCFVRIKERWGFIMLDHLLVGLVSVCVVSLYPLPVWGFSSAVYLALTLKYWYHFTQLDSEQIPGCHW